MLVANPISERTNLCILVTVSRVVAANAITRTAIIVFDIFTENPSC